jgi:hypothetical protein
VSINVPYQDPHRRLLLALDDKHRQGGLSNSVDRVAYEILWKLADNEQPSLEDIEAIFAGQSPQVTPVSPVSEEDTWHDIVLRVVNALGKDDPAQALEAVRTLYDQT